ncbi:MAG: hypothetical protein ACRDHD_04610 [Candidatus Limnocylindria bacterium]
MFGRGRHRQDEEAAREAERRALFEELAKRPDTVCPFLGLAEARTEYRDGVTDEHRCYAFGDPAELSAEQQQKVCLQRGYGNCPRYLRGVLVIPTEELEALRRPQPMPPAPQPPAPAPAPAGGGGGRRLAVLALALLLAVGVGAGTFVFLGQPDGVAQTTPTPSATLEATPAPSATAVPTAEPPSPTPLPETPPPEPTPAPQDEFVGFEVSVHQGDYVIYQVNAAGEILAERPAGFNDWSFASVEEVTAPNGLHHWRTISGDYTGFSYIAGESGSFFIREVYRAADGTRRSILLPEDEL